MTTIGYATLQIIPSLDGVEAAVDKQLGGKLRASGKTQGKQLAKGVGEGLKDLERDVDSAAKAYGRLRDKASDSLGKVRSDEAALKKLRDSGAGDDRIIRAEERLAKSRRDSNRALKEAEAGHRTFTAAQSALANSSGALSNNLGGLAGVASRLGPMLASAGVAATGLAVGGVALLAAGVVKVTAELYELGAQFDDTFDGLRIKTGATGADLKGLEESVKRVSTGVPLAIGDIGNVVGETSRALHLTGSDLDDVSKNIANLGRLTGENVDIRTLGQAFRGFGVDAKDQVPALDSMLQATQATGIGVNELLGIMAKSGAGLRGFNLSFGESAALATEFEKLGLDPAKGLQGFTKGLASLAKDGKTGRDALQGTVTEIQDLIKAGNDPAARDLTNKLFGAKGGSQFFEAIRGGALDLQALANAFTGTGDTIQQAADDTDDFAERWQEFKNQASVALEPLATGVFDAINTQLTGLADTVSAHQPEIIGFFTGLADAALAGAQVTIKSVGLLAEGFGQIAGGIGNIVGGVAQFEAFMADLSGDTEKAAEFRRQADDAFGWGEELQAFGRQAKDFKLDGIRDEIRSAGETARQAAEVTRDLGGSISLLPDEKTIVLKAPTADVLAGIDQAKYAIEQIPGTKDFRIIPRTAEATTAVNSWISQQTGKKVDVAVKPNLGQANADMQNFLDRWTKTIIAPPVRPAQPGPPLPKIPSLTDPNRPPLGGGRAAGGAISGAGTRTSDSIPAWLSTGEHVFTAADVDAMGGQAGVYAFRNALRHRRGGEPMMVPWGVDPHGGRYGKGPGERESAGPFGPWWDQDWMPTEHPGRLGPGQPGEGNKWWYRGPAGKKSPFKFPPIGRKPGTRPRTPDDPIVNGNDPRLKPWAFAGGFSTGGAVGPDVEVAGSLVGTAYDQGSRTDCSGMVARVINGALGLPNSGLMSTKNAQEWLAARGFMPGLGGPGAISVGWYDHGPNPNDGHMAMTLSDGTPAEAGGGVGDLFMIGGGAAGASAPEFDHHMYLPVVVSGSPQGPAGDESPFANGSAVAAMAGSGMQAVTGTADAAGKGGSGEGSAGGPGIPDSFSAFGPAIGEFVGGQIKSALGVFGVPDSPGWLKAASTLIGGINVKDSNGNTVFDGSNPFGGLGSPQGQAGANGVAPLAATPSTSGAPMDNAANAVHAGTGKPPGPPVVYNIAARDTEDVFIKAQRIERERAAAKLQRF